MRSKNLLVLAAAAAALFAFIFFFERHQPTTDERAERADRVFAELDEESVAAVELIADDDVIRLEKSGDEWRIAAPIDYPADATAVRTLLRTLASLDHDRMLPIAELDPAAYGLDDPELGVALTDDDGRLFELAVGGEMPLGGKRAVRRGDEAAILLCPGSFVSQLEKGLDDWRSRDLVNAFEADLESVRIEASGDVIFVRRDGERWQLTEPLDDLADGEQMRSLVSELNALRISEFIAEDSPAAVIEPGDIEYRVVMERADDRPTITLELARPVDGETGIRCRRNGVETVRIPDTIRARLGKAPVLWRSAKVWPFSTFDVGKVELTSRDSTLVLDKVDGVWTMDDGAEAEQAEVRRRLNALADLEAREHDLMLPPTEVLGSVIVVRDDDGGAEGFTYTFYAPIEDGGYAAVTVTPRRGVMAVDPAVVDTILGDLDRLRPAEPGPDNDSGVVASSS